jgi:hypothetical protein
MEPNAAQASRAFFGGRAWWPPSASRALVLAVAAGLATACAKRTDERIREAWGGGSKNAEAGASGGGAPGDGPDGETEGVPVREGWDRLDEILDGALAEASLGTDEEVMARLAERWCDVQPEPQPTDEGPVLVCIPDPPVQIDGHAFSLELGGEGVIGLVATELSSEESSALADEALRRTERWCTRPWNDVSPRPTEPPPPAPAAQLYTCPVEGSALLVVARFISSAQAGRWQVSVAVIDAS